MLLTFVAVRVAHDAVYLAEHGVGQRLQAALTHTGHDGHGLATAVAAILATILLTAAGAVRLVGLARRERARLHRRGTRTPAAGLSFHGEALRLWTALLPVTTVAFVAQEAAERWAHRMAIVDLVNLLGTTPLRTLFVIAAVTLVAACVGALVRWRVRQLEARLAAGQHGPARVPIPAAQPPSRAWIAAALCSRYWAHARQDPGRAPPLTLRT